MLQVYDEIICLFYRYQFLGLHHNQFPTKWYYRQTYINQIVIHILFFNRKCKQLESYNVGC